MNRPFKVGFVGGLSTGWGPTKGGMESQNGDYPLQQSHRKKSFNFDVSEKKVTMPNA